MCSNSVQTWEIFLALVQVPLCHQFLYVMDHQLKSNLPRQKWVSIIDIPEPLGILSTNPNIVGICQLLIHCKENKDLIWNGANFYYD